MENFSPELIQAQTEAELMKEKIKSGDAKDYNEAEKLIADKRPIEDRPSILLKDIENRLGDMKIENDEKKELRVEYRHIIEKTFNKFTSESGEANFKDYKQFLIYWDNFHEFMKKEEIPFGVSYDLGLRFNIEAISNNPRVDEKNRQIIKQYLLKMTPHSLYSNEERTKLKSEFMEDTEDKKQMIDDLSLIIKDSFIQSQIVQGARVKLFELLYESRPESFEKINQTLDAANIDEKLPSEFSAIWDKDRPGHIDATLNTVLYAKDYVDLRFKLSDKYNLDYWIDKKKEKVENEQAVLDVFKNDLGIDLLEISKNITK